MKNAIITGATGIIGTALIKELINNNIEVLVFTRINSTRNNKIPKHQLVKIKYCELEEIGKIKNDFNEKYDVFFHLAWAGSSGKERDDKELQQKNIKYVLDAVDCAKKFGCYKFIGIGSQAEYGRKNHPIKTYEETNPETEYGKAKLEAFIKTKSLANNFSIEHIWCRVFSVYGPNDRNNTLISSLVENIKNNKEMKITKCEQIWDFLYSEDAGSCLYCIGKNGKSGKVYNIASGKPGNVFVW